MKKRALISVTDKTGIVEFAASLSKLGFELVSTGGTAKALREAELAVLDVSEVTGSPEMLDGRVKTLHPMIHGGILGDTQLETHRAQMAEHGIEPFQVVCVNLYEFEKTVTQPHSFAEAVESIDIGGPAMIRAAAKNSKTTYVVVDPNDYERVAAELGAGQNSAIQRELMAKAFRHTAHYDSMISRYLSGPTQTETLTVGMKQVQSLRYGENPHQAAALYVDPLAKGGVAHAKLLWGKELSYNNLLDADAAWELVSDLPEGSCAIIKHGNPCGVAHRMSLGESYRAAKKSDPISAFGGIAAFHGTVDAEAAQAMTEPGNFLEVVLAVRFTDEALNLFREKSGWGQSVRLLELEISPSVTTQTLRSIRGGFLVQDLDEEPETSKFEVVTERQPTTEETAALKFLWRIIPHVKSNAIIIGNSDTLLGVGAGQMNRVQSVRLALEQCGELSRGACLASDAFFPFSDSVLQAAAAGIAAIIQPGGSKKDQDSIDAANEHKISMVCTGTRHFRH